MASLFKRLGKGAWLKSKPVLQELEPIDDIQQDKQPEDKTKIFHFRSFLTDIKKNWMDIQSLKRKY